MKPYRVFLLLSLFLMGISSACADVSMTPIDGTTDFNINGLSAAEDGTLLAYGSRGDLMNAQGAILKLNLDGSSENITPACDTHEGHYRGVIQLDNDRLIGLRSIPNDPDYAAFSIAEFADGQMTWHTDPTDNMFFIEPVDDHFFAYGKPAASTSVIWNFGMDGTLLGKLEMKERIVLSGILIGENSHIAYGERLENPKSDGTDQKSDTLIFCFDNNGDILWRHDGDAAIIQRSIKDAAWASDGSAVCIENYGIAKFDSTGEIWRIPIDRGNAEAILKVNAEYWIFGANEDYQGMQIISVSESGAILHQKDFPEINGDRIYPFTHNGEVYAILDSGTNHPLTLVQVTDAFE